MADKVWLQAAIGLLCAVFSGAALAQPQSAEPEEAAEKCVNPDPYALEGGEFAGLERADYLYTGSNRLRWLFISWEGPWGGDAFVLDCKGHVLAKHALGYIHKLDTGPLLDGNMSVEAVYVPDSGTGIRDESVAVLRFDGQTISVVWDHPTDDEASFANDMWTWEHTNPGDYRMRTEIDKFDWTYARDGTEIHVTGKHTVELGGRTRTRALPTEKYCFRSAANKYVRCR